jgi:ParB family chromosome partitioning protein
MNQLTTATASLPVHFEPQATKQKDEQANALIQYARKVKDWPLLERAIDEKIEEQEEFLVWWGANVSTGHGGDRTIKITDPLSCPIPADRAEELTGISTMQVSRWRKNLKDRDKYRVRLFGAAYQKAWGGDTSAHVALNTGEHEWYTPPEYLDAARQVMGGIDLDPASSVKAQAMVRAETFYTKDDNGLEQAWRGSVWMNPPYAQPLVAQFCAKLLEELPNLSHACVLVNNATETRWLQALLIESDAVCFPVGRVRFLDPDGNPGAPLQGQSVVYFGPNVAGFNDAFSAFGVVLMGG